MTSNAPPRWVCYIIPREDPVPSESFKIGGRAGEEALFTNVVVVEGVLQKFDLPAHENTHTERAPGCSYLPLGALRSSPPLEEEEEEALLLLLLLLADAQEDCFAVVVDAVDLVDVGSVVASAAVHNILCPVPNAVDRVLAEVAQERVRTGIAVYGVVAFPAKHRVVANAGVEQVRGCQTGDVVYAPTAVDCVGLICAY